MSTFDEDNLLPVLEVVVVVVVVLLYNDVKGRVSKEAGDENFKPDELEEDTDIVEDDDVDEGEGDTGVSLVTGTVVGFFC